MHKEFDVIIIGAGLAGQTAALSLADTKSVLLVVKSDLPTSASSLAQGGIAVVFQEPDTIEKHYDDTLVAGAYLNDAVATHFILSNGKQAVDWLIDQGVPFTTQDGSYHLTREGGHGERRILHVDDLTGKSVQDTLTEHVIRHPNISILENHTAIKLLPAKIDPRICAGAVLIDNLTGEQRHIKARFTILATGGAGQIFPNATAPSTSTGDGIALAWDMGCRISNLEFLQFHPTCMYYPQGDVFLITEAVRGEGGHLKLPNGHRFMAEYDERLELAPRDLVARAIYNEMKKNNIPAVYLDISHKSPEFIKGHFPNIYEKCLERGIDMTREPIPVTPASHYTCGGVITDIQGKTDIENLYCIGETSCTGLHGANRLASNSLLECVVMGKAAAQDICFQDDVPLFDTLEVIMTGRRLTDREKTSIELAKSELRQTMWSYVGIVRNFDSLDAARRRLQLLAGETEGLYADCLPETELTELRSLLTTSKLMVDCAILRQESRGCHFNEDCLIEGAMPVSTVISP